MAKVEIFTSPVPNRQENEHQVSGFVISIQTLYEDKIARAFRIEKRTIYPSIGPAMVASSFISHGGSILRVRHQGHQSRESLIVVLEKERLLKSIPRPYSENREILAEATALLDRLGRGDNLVFRFQPFKGDSDHPSGLLPPKISGIPYRRRRTARLRGGGK